MKSQINTSIQNSVSTFQEKEISFSVQGMTCASCVRNVERAIKNIDGVKYVSVNLATEKAIVIADEKVTIEDIEKAVEGIGYKVSRETPTENLIEKRFKEAKKDLIISLIITIPLMIIMIFHMSGFHIPYMVFIELVGGGIVLFYPGRKTLKSAWIALSHFHTNMDTLVSIGALSSWFTTILVIFEIKIQSFGSISAMLVTLNILGKYIESRMKYKASKDIQALIALKVEKANVLIDNEIVELPVDAVKIGDKILIRKGEKVPVDGVIIEGKATIDESMVTGESLPVFKTVGDQVISGTIIESGVLKVEVQKIGEDLFINQMIKLIEEAQSSKVPIQAFADRITIYFIPIVFSLAFLSGFFRFFNYETFQPFLVRMSNILPWVLVDAGPFSTALFSFIATLVIACPCALGLATPMALLSASGAAAKRGLIIKNGEAIQMAKNIDVVLFDKTGTITEGRPSVVWHNLDEETLMVVANIEENSTHPLANSIIEYVKNNYQLKNIENINLEEVEEISGLGIFGTYRGDSYFIGKPKDFSRYQKFLQLGETIVEVSINDHLRGYIRIADKIKPNAINTIYELKNMNIKPILVTGDNEVTARIVAEQVGVDEFWANVSPSEKVGIVRKYQIEGKRVCMVGDGINDAAALKASEIGVAIGTGTDLAIESADIIIIQGEISKIIDAIEISKITFQKIKQNLFWAFFYNVIMIPLAMMGIMHPVISEIAMFISSINVILNSTTIEKKLQKKRDNHEIYL
ncbi:MAG TPA: cation-translocating P-type ATPase [Defluviitoga sp.]|nr:cation-translocating P-type ATPase [Defluviitoga sp.]HOP24285.1 cation-translocating P-type ATPase [Defluviitoga sp.]HPZ28123.1 cation-translocating P-type ATPase [Defluviitoga sp.]HQD62013.1 cation-translocating P-type ATPase [Defluviitoga sp.]